MPRLARSRALPAPPGSLAHRLPTIWRCAQCFFTKLFEGRPIEEIGARAAELQFDGIDLLVRRGFAVDPDDAAGIPTAVRALRGTGLEVPMVTTDITDTTSLPADRMLGACAEAGVRLVRLGHWKYGGETAYADALDAARRDLDQLEQLARKHEVSLAIQLHGGTIHASGALTSTLLAGRDPARFGAYPDPGNQAVQNGREDWRLTFDVLRPWLRCVGVKNGGWFQGEPNAAGQYMWGSRWLGIAEGMVPWDEICTHLVTTGFEGLLSFHSHYALPYEQVLDQTRSDLRHLRRLLLRTPPVIR